MISTLVATRAVIVAGFVGLFVTILYYRHRVSKKLEWFLFTPESALNVGVFRIVLCGYILYYVKPDRILQYSQLPSYVILPPWGMHYLSRIVPINHDVSVVFLVLFYTFGLTAMVGLLTRYSLPLFGISAFYVLTVPQLFGKVNHYHHLIWFLLILIISPSGKSLSLDALVDEDSSFFKTSSSPIYGVPLKLCWLLIGVMYFFPGFWKLWENGLAWFSGQNLKLILHHQWYQSGSIPIWRLDQYPLLLQSGALFTVLFEMGFLPALFHPYSLIVFVISGIAFHTLNQVFLFISFTSLLVTYVIFFNWAALLQQSRWSRNLRDFVRFGRSTPSADRTPSNPGMIRRMLLVGLALVLINTAAGVNRTLSGWPFACYPTFAAKPAAAVWSLQFEVRTDEGTKTLPEEKIRAVLNVPGDRFKGPVRDLLYDETVESFERKAETILKALKKKLPGLRANQSVKIYSVKRSVQPERQGRVLKRNLVTTVRIP